MSNSDNNPLLSDIEKSEFAEPFCRICFEEDNEENLFSPCRCCGDQRYVHRDCLDQWRAMSPTGEAIYRCMACKYNYRINDSNRYELDNYPCQVSQFLARHYCYFLALNLALVFFGGSAIRYFDKGFVIGSWMHSFLNPSQNVINNGYIYYYLLVSYCYLMILLLTFFCNLLFMKNKRLYIKYFCGHFWYCGAIRFIGIVAMVVIAMLINIVIGLFLLTLEIQLILGLHYKYLEQLQRANLNMIMPYDRRYDSDPSAIEPSPPLE